MVMCKHVVHAASLMEIASRTFAHIIRVRSCACGSRKMYTANPREARLEDATIGRGVTRLQLHSSKNAEASYAAMATELSIGRRTAFRC